MIGTMNNKIALNNISIRTELQPGDIGYVIYLHGLHYSREYNFGIQFEDYVAKGLIEFKEKYDPSRNRFGFVNTGEAVLWTSEAVLWIITA